MKSRAFQFRADELDGDCSLANAIHSAFHYKCDKYFSVVRPKHIDKHSSSRALLNHLDRQKSRHTCNTEPMSPYSLAQALNSIHAKRDNFQLKNKSMLNSWPTGMC